MNQTKSTNYTMYVVLPASHIKVLTNEGISRREMPQRHAARTTCAHTRKCQVVLDTTHKACRKKFSVARIIVKSSDRKHILAVRRYSFAESNIGGNAYQIFVGQVAAIDVYFWIHKGAILCAESKHRGKSTIGNYIRFWHVCERS